MQRLRAHLRRRSHDDSKAGSANAANVDGTKAPLPHSRRSLESRRDRRTAGGSQHIPGQGNARRKKDNEKKRSERDISDTACSNTQGARGGSSEYSSTLGNRIHDALVPHAGDNHGPRERLINDSNDDPVGAINPKDHGLLTDADTALNPTNTVDTDETICYAPSVIHETVRPHVHEIVAEQVYREIHNHDVYHRVQPVYDIEFLPARHFVPGPNGNLVEVAEEELPFAQCAGQNQQWFIGKKQPPVTSSTSKENPEASSQHSAAQKPVDSTSPVHLMSKTLDSQGLRGMDHDSWQSSATRAM